jgi:TusA-related sulfurtransferase
MLTQKAVKGMQRGTVEILVDSSTALDNVGRLAKNSGWVVTVEKQAGASHRLVLKK